MTPHARLLLSLLLACSCSSAALVQASQTTPAQTKPADATTTDKKADEPKQDDKKPDEAKQSLHWASLETSLGTIVLELNRDKAPISVDNFLAYVDKGHYSGTIFHRVISNFMIQGGGFTDDLKQKATDKPIKNEWRNGLKNVRGSIAMARTNVPDSATSQFFINVQDNPGLDRPRDGAAYAVFGRVVHGMDVVDRIRNVRTGTSGGMDDVPSEVIKITAAKRLTKEQVDVLTGDKPADDKPDDNKSADNKPADNKPAEKPAGG